MKSLASLALAFGLQRHARKILDCMFSEFGVLW